MIEIRINGLHADINPDTKIALERFNPMLDFDTVQGNRVYDFTLPDTPTNRKLFGYANNAQIPFRNRRFYCEKYVNSQLLEYGYVKIAESSPELSLWFAENLGEIFGDRQNILLSVQTDFGSDPADDLAGEGLRYVFPKIENDGFYGDTVKDGYNGIMNEFTAGVYNPVCRVPMFFVKYIFERFGELTGWTFTGDFFSDPDTSRLVFFNLYSLDGSDTCYYNNHLPNLTAGGFLIELRKLFNLYLSFDISRKICRVDFVEDLLNAPAVVDWSEKASKKHIKTPDLNNRLEISYTLDSNDAILKPIPPAMDRYITPETAENEGGTLLAINSEISTLLMGETMPVTRQAGLSVEVKENRSASTPKVLFSTGLHTASNTYTNRSLLFTGDKNLIEKSWTRYEQFREKTFLITKPLTLNAADLARFKFFQKVHIQGVNYIVGKLNLELSNAKYINCLAELWRV